jgi:hypothetical protein
MARILAVAGTVAAVLSLGGCAFTNPAPGPSVGLAPAKTPHTAKDLAACNALDAIYAGAAAHQPGTSAQGQALITAALAADNADLLHEAATLQSAAANGNAKGVQAELEVMSGTCDGMGIGPSGG